MRCEIPHSFEIIGNLLFIKQFSSRVSIHKNLLKTRNTVITLKDNCIDGDMKCITVKISDIVELLRNTSIFEITDYSIKYNYTENINGTIIKYDKEIKYENIDLFNNRTQDVDDPDIIFRLVHTDIPVILTDDIINISIINNHMVLNSTGIIKIKRSVGIIKLDENKLNDKYTVKGKDIKHINDIINNTVLDGDVVVALFSRCIIIYKFNKENNNNFIMWMIPCVVK